MPIETMRVRNGQYDDLLITYLEEDNSLKIRHDGDKETIYLELGSLEDFIKSLRELEVDSVCRAEPAKEAKE